MTVENYVAFKQMSLRSELQPVKVKLKHKVLTFVQEFFEEISSSMEQKGAGGERRSTMVKAQPSRQSERPSMKKQPTKEEPPTYIKDVRVKPTSLCLSYKGRGVQINELAQGNLFELMHLFSIHDLVLEVKAFELTQKTKLTPEQAVQKFIDHQVDHIMANQKLSIMGSIGPMRGIYDVSSGFFSLLRKPVENGSFFRGFAEGANTLHFVLSQESANLRDKIVKLGVSISPI